MKYSVFSWFGYFMDFCERLALIKKVGFDEVMISWEDEGEPYPRRKEEMPELVRGAGLAITNIHAPFRGYNVIWEEPAEVSRPLLDELISYVADCRTYDIPAIVVHTHDQDLAQEIDFDRGLAFFSELAEAGERYGVDIAVENLSRQEMLIDLLDKLDTPRLGMCYDSSHDFCYASDRYLLKNYKQRIKALHLSDNDLIKDRHWLPGEGVIPFGEVLTELAAIDFPVRSFEVIADSKWQQRSPAEFLERLRHSLDNYE